MNKEHDSFYDETFKAEFLKRASDLKLSFDQDSLQKIAKSHLEDLTNIPGIFFDADTKEFISTAAGRSLAQVLSKTPRTDLQNLWPHVIESFRTSYWGFTPFKEEQTQQRTDPYKELKSYIFILIQAMIVMKVVIFYFGLKGAADSSTTDKVITALAIAFSFSSLCFFAWRKSRKKK